MNGQHDGEMITVLYKVVNAECDAKGLYNAFSVPRNVGVTLKTVKEHCQALNHLSHAGSEGFHWRVCVEDKTPAGGKGGAFSWWDIQDENARLPVKEYGMSQVQDMFMPGSGGSTSGSDTSGSSTDTATKAAKGAFKGMAKAMNAVASAVEGGSGAASDHGPRVPLIAFKLLDLVKVNDDFALKHGGSMGHTPVAAAPRAPKASRQPQQPSSRGSAPTQQRRAAPAAGRPTPAARPAKPAGEPSLMDFGSSGGGRAMHHASSAPGSFPNETRAEKLKREYAQKKQNANRVWDDVDQRWVEVGKGAAKAGSQSAPPRPAASTGKKTVGIKLGDPRAAAGKSANVQQAVHARNNDMRESQQKAVAEIRQREAKKAKNDAEEDEVRKRLEPKIKAWSEEYGKKKQLRALLATLQTVLWQGAAWKPVGIGDMMDNSKVKRAFHKASRVVHPDKTVDLDAEKRFLAKRIFDALSQAKTDFDEGK